MHHSSSRTARLGAALSLATLALGFGVAPAKAASPTDLGNAHDYFQLPAGSMAKIVPGKWLVQVAGNPSIKGGNDKANAATQDSVVQAARARGITINVKSKHSQLWNGMAVEVSTEQAQALRSIPNVVNVFPLVSFAMPDPRPAALEPNIANAITMTGAAQAQATGYTGKGIKVGVIDSGIDLDHADLGGDGVPGNPQFPNARVKWGYDFVGDNYDANGENGSTTPTPDPIPDDCGGHGTHVAGIIGANGGGRPNSVTGVAPDVELGAYRVFGCDGSTDSDIMLAAMERAVADGMDIINMSIGASFETWPDYPTAVAADAAVDKGVIVTVSAGNSGESGTFSTGAPSVANKVISVASFENTVITTRAFQLNGRTIGYSAGDSAPVPTTGTMQVVSAGPDVAPSAMTGTEPVTGCPDARAGITVDATGKALLMKRGVCTFYEKALTAQRAGASMAIIYNRDNTLLSPGLTGDQEPITIPVVIITLADGLALQQEIAAKGSATITFGDWTSQQPNPQAGLVSSFSSYGATADLDLKPDLGAPGGNIWSTYPLEKGAYANLSGTSMAAPHVAGSVALLLQARPEYKRQPAAVRDTLQNNATPGLWHLAPKYGLLDTVWVQGAGLINILDTINAKVTINPGKLVLGEGYDAKNRTVTLTNKGAAAVTFTTGVRNGIGTSAPNYDPTFDYLEATAAMPATVTVPAGGQVQVPVTITPPAGAPNGYLYGGWLTFTAGDNDLVVPFGGMAGDYQAEKILINAPDGTVVPALGKVDPATGKIAPIYPKPGELPVYTAKSDPVALMFYLDYPTADVQIHVYEATKDGAKGAYVGTYGSLGKTGRTGGVVSISWDGTYLKTTGNKESFKKAGPGNYILELRVLKPLGDPNDPAMWEIWDSPAFRLKSMN